MVLTSIVSGSIPWSHVQAKLAISSLQWGRIFHQNQYHASHSKLLVPLLERIFPQSYRDKIYYSYSLAQGPCLLLALITSSIPHCHHPHDWGEDFVKINRLKLLDFDTFGHGFDMHFFAYKCISMEFPSFLWVVIQTPYDSSKLTTS